MISFFLSCLRLKVIYSGSFLDSGSFKDLKYIKLWTPPVPEDQGVSSKILKSKCSKITTFQNLNYCKLKKTMSR